MEIADQIKKLTVTDAARFLLGKVLVHQTNGEKLSGKIVETEAYHQSDPSAHTFMGQTERNKAMFGPAGHAYIYFTYGAHYCFNVTAEEAGEGAGVLVRALEPLEGVETMRKNRNQNSILALCSGPGKLTEAMQISKSLYGHDLTKPPLWLATGDQLDPREIITTTRIGITKSADEPLRYYIKNNPFISKK